MDNQNLIIVGILFAINIFFLIYLFLQQSKTQRKIADLLRNSSGKSIEDSIAQSYAKLDEYKYIIEKNNSEVKFLNDVLKKNFSKVSVVTYNAYEDTGGNLSFVICLLNNENNGFMINSLHSRSVTRLYAKEVQNGEYSGNLSNEEGEALSKAISK